MRQCVVWHALVTALPPRASCEIRRIVQLHRVLIVMLSGACVLPVGLVAPAGSLARRPLRPTAPAARWVPPPRSAFINERFLEGMPSSVAQLWNPGLAGARQRCY